MSVSQTTYDHATLAFAAYSELVYGVEVAYF